MLYLTRKDGERIRLEGPTGEVIEVLIVNFPSPRQTRIGIDAPAAFKISRVDRAGRTTVPGNKGSSAGSTPGSRQRRGQLKHQPQRRYQHERQPFLPWDGVTREINRRDLRRETQTPEQLELLSPVQPKLFSNHDESVLPPIAARPKCKTPKHKKPRRRRQNAPSATQLKLALDGPSRAGTNKRPTDC